MSNVLEGLRYSKEHEWAKLDGDVVTMGISDFAQEQLTDVVFVELPQKGKAVEHMKPFCAIESVKSVSDIYAPASGEVVEVNESLADAPEKVNNSPFEEGWIAKIKIKNADELNSLMSAEEYKKYLAESDH